MCIFGLILISKCFGRLFCAIAVAGSEVPAVLLPLAQEVPSPPTGSSSISRRSSSVLCEDLSVLCHRNSSRDFGREDFSKTCGIRGDVGRYPFISLFDLARLGRDLCLLLARVWFQVSFKGTRELFGVALDGCGLKYASSCSRRWSMHCPK